jgi:hypothetical protein
MERDGNCHAEMQKEMERDARITNKEMERINVF